MFQPIHWCICHRFLKGDCRDKSIVAEKLSAGLLRLMVDGHGTLRAIFLAEPEEMWRSPGVDDIEKPQENGDLTQKN